MNLQLLFQNKHTSGSAAAYALVKMGAVISRAWWPEHERQIQVTADALEGFAVFYLGVAAVDAGQAATKRDELRKEVKVAISTGDTSILDKPKDPPK